jgi:hypothetical protein
MRGRLPSGPEYVEQLEGSAIAKERVKVIMETIAGTCRVQEACQRLGISEPRFEQLRIQIFQAALQRLEPRPAGRPVRTLTPAEERIDALEAENAELKMKLRVSQTRTEIALALPNVVQKRAAEPTAPDATQDEAAHAEVSNTAVANSAVANAPEKKTRQRRPSARARAPASRMNT